MGEGFRLAMGDGVAMVRHSYPFDTEVDGMARFVPLAVVALLAATSSAEAKPPALPIDPLDIEWERCPIDYEYYRSADPMPAVSFPQSVLRRESPMSPCRPTLETDLTAAAVQAISRWIVPLGLAAPNVGE